MKTRDAYYDNAKFLLVFFVVFGHFIQSYIEEDKLFYTIYTTIYTFHMPAFILISGFFAKGFQKKGYIKKLFKKLIIPYLIFQGIYSFYYYFINEVKSIELDPLNPQWSLWFLVSLFCWNVMLYVFTKWKAGIALLVSAALGVAVGYFDEINSYLSLSRTFVFFPFFLLGYYLNNDYFKRIREKKFRFTSFIILISIFITIYLVPEFEYKWFFGSKPYDSLEPNHLNGGLIRIGVYCLTLLATLSFLALVPRKKFFFTQWGTSTLYVYLLHGFFIKFFRNSELVDIINHSEQIIVLILLSIFLVIFLSSKMVRRISQPIIELRFSFFNNTSHQQR
ncbi:acyltransferase family protein [Neobacillus thermocopriae]|uniref:Acyltransferase family protein n=1 Tax=Neobacillus thermocopriae TaxID=1215031 RepID=A0A6B3TQH6_9BACI|nr:acyltransferase family protein [Neobacillus thermocopriae]MED3623944.1 acyltransferase family protein [Neobacillus thermocopriae]MED3713861.1 acyltransferase family protein [Neobacillus thermocopriae]NEX77997.1 acyltransferase family protein [Neobacillus thermocopriae]